jgi:hypothetical protein
MQNSSESLEIFHNDIHWRSCETFLSDFSLFFDNLGEKCFTKIQRYASDRSEKPTANERGKRKRSSNYLLLVALSWCCKREGLAMLANRDENELTLGEKFCWVMRWKTVGRLKERFVD